MHCTLYTEQLLKEQHERDNFVDTRIAFLQHQVSVSTAIMQRVVCIINLASISILLAHGNSL